MAEGDILAVFSTMNSWRTFARGLCEKVHSQQSGGEDGTGVVARLSKGSSGSGELLLEDNDGDED